MKFFSSWVKYHTIENIMSCLEVARLKYFDFIFSADYFPRTYIPGFFYASYVFNLNDLFFVLFDDFCFGFFSRHRWLVVINPACYSYMLLSA